jgi:ferredoxin
LFRTEFGTVVVQEDICNGCGYCIPACPYGVIDQRKDDGRAWKCTLCYDRIGDGLTPACAQACPTQSIQYGELDELRERAQRRLEALHEAGTTEAQLYGHDPNDGVGGDGVRTAARPHRHDPGSARDVASGRRGGTDHGGGRRGGVRREAGMNSRPDTKQHRRDADVMVPKAEFRSYYGRPIVKAPVWHMDIAEYLFTGGLAAGSALLAAGGDLTARPALRRAGRLTHIF